MSSLGYINSKLSDAIYILTTHKGDARTRLAQVIPKVSHLSTSSFPVELQSDFEWVIEQIEKGIGVIPPDLPPSPPPSKLTGITNDTASKVIIKLVFIQDKINLLVESELD